MSMPTADLYGESFVDPDELKMPESPEHRNAAALIEQRARNLLSDDHEVYGDMNWYPLDGGQPMAPDVMVLPHTPDGLVLSGNSDWILKLQASADAAVGAAKAEAARAAEASERAAEATERAEALAEKLRAPGVDPEA